jgi:hypothetical protein
MSISAHALAVVVPKMRLATLKKCLAKGEARCAAKKIDPAVMLGLRLAPDMYPLVRQVQLMTDFAKGPAARLAGVDVPAMPDVETTFEQLYARIDKTIAFLDTLAPAAFEGAMARTVTFKAGGADRSFKGDDYLANYAHANLYFHMVTAYDILRQAGVEIGKRDFLGAV